MKPSDKNESSPLISVIIPTYNRAAMVCEAIDSVLAQDYSPFELIVVDDGSTDETPDRLAAYGDSIRVLTQENRGVSAARNLGIREAKGDYLAFLDSDDLWETQKLSCQMDFFKSHPDIRICQSEEIWIRKGKRVNPMNKHKKLSGMLFEPYLHICLVSPSAVMIKRGLLDQVGLFDESLPACEDYDLWLRIACRYPMYTTCAKHVIKKGGHPGQLSSAPGLDKYRVQSMVKLLESGILTPDQDTATRTVLSEKCRIYALGCRKHGKHEEADIYERIGQDFGRRPS